MEEILQLYELQYSDLMALLSDQTPASNEELRRLELISDTLMQNLGRHGPGLLSITGVPKARNLPQTLLPLARKLALLNHDDRKRILKDHSLGSDVPLKNLDRTVSSFAMQMKYDEMFDVEVDEGDEMAGDFRDLGFAFRELGFCMMELGLCLARVCDKLIGGCELEQSLLQSGTAKGRLIHYHSVLDNAAIKGASRKQQRGRGKANSREDVKLCDRGDRSELWQQWHYDYGIFTVLTAPMFMLSDGNGVRECESPSGHTYLQVFHPEMKRVLKVKACRNSFIVQVGESADVLSKGRLRATLHSVVNEGTMDNLSRETFVVFLQPAWSKTFSLSDYPINNLMLDDKDSETCNAEMNSANEGFNGSTRNIHDIVPPLFSRLRHGMSFVEFSRETTKQYYGGSGLQPNK